MPKTCCFVAAWVILRFSIIKLLFHGVLY
jgi:hypothetical protein